MKKTKIGNKEAHMFETESIGKFHTPEYIEAKRAIERLRKLLT